MQFGIENTKDEHVIIENRGDVYQIMTGWTLSDDAHHTFSFPNITIPVGGKVKIWTKPGENDETNLYWMRKSSIWNKEGDIAYLRDNSNVLGCNSENAQGHRASGNKLRSNN